MVSEASGLILGTIIRDNHIGGGNSIFPERMKTGYIRGSRPHTKCQVVREPCQRPGTEGTSAAERGSWEIRQHRDANRDKCYGERLLVITDRIQRITYIIDPIPCNHTHMHMYVITHTYDFCCLDSTPPLSAPRTSLDTIPHANLAASGPRWSFYPHELPQNTLSAHR